MTALIDLHFLPSLEYFCALQQFEAVILEQHEHYVKQGYRNRCYINTSQGVRILTVPLTEKHGKVVVKEVQIDYSTKWQTSHWRTLFSAYKNAPYFEHYEQPLYRCLFKNHRFLFDLNLELLSFCLDAMKWHLNLSESVSYQKMPGPDIRDMRSAIQPKKPYSERSYYKTASYQQVFGSKFVPNLSFIDLLFCEGPNASRVIRASQVTD